MRKLWNLCSLVAIFFAPALSWSQEAMAIKALRAAPRQASLYEVSFSTGEVLAVDAEIRLTFPASYDLSALEIAGSTTINGGLTLTRDGQRVAIKRTGLGTAVPRGQKVSLQLGLIKNPSSFATAEPVRVEVLHSKKTTTAKAFASSVEFQSR
jgi:hypothetical protein